MTAWLHIIGCGEGGVAALPASSRLLLGYAETVLGPPRFLAGLERILENATRSGPASTDTVDQRGLEAVARALLDEDEELDEAEAILAVEGRQDERRSSRAPADAPSVIEWDGGLDGMLAQIRRLRDTPTVVLASGDPMWFGIGATLARHFPAGEFEIHPHPSAFQLAAAAMRA